MTGRETLFADAPIAALYVTKGGVYYGLPGVDPWDEERDARRYDGPHPRPSRRPSPLPEIADDAFALGVRPVNHRRRIEAHVVKPRPLPRPVPVGDLRDLRRPSRIIHCPRPALSSRLREPEMPPREREGRMFQNAAPRPHGAERGLEASRVIADAVTMHRLVHVGERTPPSARRMRDDRGDRPRMYQREALSTPEAFRDMLLDLARFAVTRTGVAA